MCILCCIFGFVEHTQTVAADFANDYVSVGQHLIGAGAAKNRHAADWVYSVKDCAALLACAGAVGILMVT